VEENFVIKLHFEKIYNRQRKNEHCSIGIPVEKGKLWDKDKVVILDCNKNIMPTQTKVTAKWNDGSIKWLFIRFMANLPANDKIDYFCDLDSNILADSCNNIKITESEKNINISTDCFKLALSKNENVIFDSIVFNNKKYDSNYISYPLLTDGNNNRYDFKIDNWKIIENGNICSIIKGEGYHYYEKNKVYKFCITLTVYVDKPWFELAYKIINTTNSVLHISELKLNQNVKSVGKVRTTAAVSNYRTQYDINENGEEVYKCIDDKYLMLEANEHNPEVFYGTFFADYTDDENGLAITIFQAQQNYPKAVKSSKNGIEVMIVPKNIRKVIMQSGMSREQKMLFHFHNPSEELSEINNRSIIYQMPDKPIVSPEVFKNANVFENVFVDKKINDVELFLISKADEHSRSYGMMNWGDSPDKGYTEQGRGGGDLVWTNNEYDFPHACALMYARTGIRRFLDYVIVTARHWIDVDICHYSDNPLYFEGQWEHTNGHCINGKIVCSHQWVEGLLDYYHFTGDKEAFDAAIGIGNNVLRLLELPVFKKEGESNARETGWALRTLTALYKETNDSKWLEKCDWIVSHFEKWEEKYGHWLSAYTDNTYIRVVFMTAIAIGSLMRYNRIKPQQKIKDMILREIDDLIENALMDNGLFYYKELPSLKRLGNNPIILEALSIAYEITNDVKYLEAGVGTFKYIVAKKNNSLNQKKVTVDDSVIKMGSGTKEFAQLMIPVTTYYKFASENNIIS